MVRVYYILGAGITGLVVAYELLKKGCKVCIIEKDGSVGGLAKTLRWHDIPLDLGPRIFHTPDKDVLEYWQKEFGELFYEREHWSKNFKDDLYFDYPISHEFIENLPVELRTEIKKELKNRDESKLKTARNYYEYMNALVGTTLQKMFFIRYPEKLWGISTKELDANWAPKRIQIREKSTPFYWGQWSAVGVEGSGSIINKLYENLKRLNCKLFLNEEIEKLDVSHNKIKSIITDRQKIDLKEKDIVINTTSYTVTSKLIGKHTNLRYRGIIIVYLYLNRASIFPKNVDFIYIDNPKILFHRVSEQSQFIKNPPKDKNIYVCEIAYTKSDNNDQKNENDLINEVIAQFESLGFIKKDEVLDAKLIKLPEVYPMFFVGYKNELSKTKADIDSVSNLYNIGSLAEYAYNDLQILFSKAIDLAELLTDKTLKINKIDKTIPRLSFQKEVRIKDEVIGNGNQTFVIAEIGLNHNGDMKLAKKLIDTAIEAGATAVKLQTYKSKNRVAKEGKTSRYVEKILGIEETDYEMLKKYELSDEQIKELFDYAKDRTIIFSTPFDLESVDELEELGVPCYKISSFDLTNIPLLQKVARTGKPMIISTGMANLSEVEEALQTVILNGNDKIVLLHCTSSYPCPPENMNIRAIDTLNSAFKVPVGLSDHVIGDVVSLAAVARGANVIEKHYTLDKNMEGPDHILSLEPEEFKRMVSNVRIIEKSLGDGIKQSAPNEFSTILRFRKAMYASRDINAGERITENDIVLKGPAYGIYPKYMDIVVGQKALVNITKDTPITWEKIGNA